MGDASLEEMASLGELIVYPSSTAQEACERVRDADVACLNKIIVDKAFLDAAPKLKLICEAARKADAFASARTIRKHYDRSWHSRYEGLFYPLG